MRILQRKYLILIASVFMTACLGSTYSWSVFVAPLKKYAGLNQGTAQLPFSVFYMVFPFTMIFAGKFLSKFGVRKCAMLGAVIFGSGWMLAGFGKYNFLYTILGIGIMGGIGVGMAYITPISVCIKWFPKHKGLVTGIAVAGFGGGAALVAHISGTMLEAQYTPFTIFRLFGFAFMLIVLIAGSIMKNPPDFISENQTQVNYKEIIFDKKFKLLYLCMFAGLAAGFTVSANMKELFREKSFAMIGVWAVSLFAIANALGRITYGMLFDKIKAVTAIRVNLLFQAVLFFLTLLLLRSPAGYLIFAFIAGFNYGGVLSLYASSTARIWGSENVGRIYGWLFSSNIPAAAAPVLAGFSFTMINSFQPFLFLTAAILVIAIGLSSILKI